MPPEITVTAYYAGGQWHVEIHSNYRPVMVTTEDGLQMESSLLQCDVSRKSGALMLDTIQTAMDEFVTQ